MLPRHLFRTATGARRLVFADQHPLVPFSARACQFFNRASSLAEHWPGPVSLWLPGPELPETDLKRRFPHGFPLKCEIEYGPAPEFLISGVRIRSKFLYRRWLCNQFDRLLKEGERPIFYFRTIRIAATLLDRMKRSGTPFAFEPHEIFYESARDPRKMMRLEQEVYRHATHLFPITQGLSEAIPRQLAVPTPRLVAPLGHGGANLGLPDYDPGAPPQFLYIGSLHGWKGLETAFEATAGFGISFEVVGDAGGLERHRALCEQRGWSHVRFHGQQVPEKLHSFYTPGTICILPLSTEKIATTYTSPLKLFEYLGAGRPIVVGKVPSVRELVSDHVHVRMAAPGDVQEWKQVISELLESPQKRAELARNARERGKICTWKERAEALAGVLQNWG